MAESLIIGYGVVFDEAGRILLLRRRTNQELWPGRGGCLATSRRCPRSRTTPFPASSSTCCANAFAPATRTRSTAKSRQAAGIPSTTPTSPRSRKRSMERPMTSPIPSTPWNGGTSSAIAELPEQQAELLSTVIERRDVGLGLRSRLNPRRSVRRARLASARCPTNSDACRSPSSRK